MVRTQHLDHVVLFSVSISLNVLQQFDLVHGLVQKVFVVLDDLHTDHVASHVI